jgi:endogenous inhibitor of DNA gyrase (YacG/DUF329 family)
MVGQQRGGLKRVPSLGSSNELQGWANRSSMTTKIRAPNTAETLRHSEAAGEATVVELPTQECAACDPNAATTQATVTASDPNHYGSKPCSLCRGPVVTNGPLFFALDRPFCSVECRTRCLAAWDSAVEHSKAGAAPSLDRLLEAYWAATGLV